MPFRRVIVSLVVLGILLGLPGIAAADPLRLAGSRQRVVAIDPGHGGRDTGAKGPGGSLEKQVCLVFAQRLTAQLEPVYKVALTRGDDYDVPLKERTAIGNNQQADLLISIHTAAGFLHTTGGIQIYSYKPNSEGEAEPAFSQGGQEAEMVWRRMQMRHTAGSALLAEKIRQALEGLSVAPSVQLHQAPLVVLEGADMPAIVIEIGYLTNPDDESHLNSTERLDLYAGALAKAIDAFLASNP